MTVDGVAATSASRRLVPSLKIDLKLLAITFKPFREAQLSWPPPRIFGRQENISDLLIGSDIPGSNVTLQVAKAGLEVGIFAESEFKHTVAGASGKKSF